MAESQDFRSNGPNCNRDGTHGSFGHQEAYNVYSQYSCSSFSEGRNFSSFRDEYSKKGTNSVPDNSSESYPRERCRSGDRYFQFCGPYHNHHHHHPSQFYASSPPRSSYFPYSSTYNYEDSYSYSRETNPRYKYNYMKSQAHAHKWNKRLDRDWSYHKNDRFNEYHQSENFHNSSRNSPEHRTSSKRYKPSTEVKTDSHVPAPIRSIQSARKQCQSSKTSNFQQRKRDDFSSPSYHRSSSRKYSFEKRDAPHDLKESHRSPKQESPSLRIQRQSEDKRLTNSKLPINSSANDKNCKTLSVSSTEKSVANLINKLYPEISKSNDMQSNINFTAERVSTDVNVVLDNTQDKRRTFPERRTSIKDVKGKNTSLKSSVLSSTNKTEVISSTKFKNSVRTEKDSHVENTSGKKELVEIKIQVKEFETSKTVKVSSPPSVRENKKEDTVAKPKTVSTVSSKSVVNFSNISCSDVVSKVVTEESESKSLRVTRCTKFLCDSNSVKLGKCDTETKEIDHKISVKDSQSETASSDTDFRRVTRSKTESTIQVSSKTSPSKSSSNAMPTTEIVESKKPVIRPKRNIVNSVSEAKCPSVVLKSARNSPKAIEVSPVSKYKPKHCKSSVVNVKNNGTIKKGKKFKFGVRNKRSMFHKVLRSRNTTKRIKALKRLRTAKIIAAKNGNSKCVRKKLQKASISNKKVPTKKLPKVVKQVVLKSKKKPLVKKASNQETKFAALKNLQKNVTLSRQMAAANSKIRLSKVKKASSCLIKQQVQKARKSLVSKDNTNCLLVSVIQLPIKKKKKKYFRGGRYNLSLSKSSKKKSKKSQISGSALERNTNSPEQSKSSSEQSKNSLELSKSSPEQSKNCPEQSKSSPEQSKNSSEQNKSSSEQNKQHSARKSFPKNSGMSVSSVSSEVIPLFYPLLSDVTVSNSRPIQQLSSMPEENSRRFSLNAPTDDKGTVFGKCRKTCISNDKTPGEMPLACILRNSMDLRTSKATTQPKSNTAKKSFVSVRFGNTNKKFTQNFMMTSRTLESSVTLNNDGFEKTSRLIERQFVFSTMSLCEKSDSSSQESKSNKYMCCCRKLPVEIESNLTEDEKMCQAVDMIDGKMVGCSNHFQNLSATPSPNLELIVMCQPHLFRLQHHQCCPVCGVFCSQGIFMRCKAFHQPGENSEFHLFHHKCLKESSCPHCMKSSDLENVKIMLNPDKSLIECAVRPPSIRNKINAMSNEEKCAALLLNQDNVQNSSASSASLNTKSVPQGNQTAYKRTVKAFHSALKLGNAMKVQHYLGCDGVSVNQVFDTDDNNRPLHIAASLGHIMIVKMLVKCGADTEEKNDQLSTPLMLAIRNNRAQVAEYLLILTRNVLYPDIQGATCFHAAAQSGNKQLCELIYENEAHLDLDLQDEGGWTALVWACEHKHHDIARWLLLKGANPDIRDREGNIALHWAAFSGAADILALLIEYSSCINPPNLLGNTPLHIAAQQGRYDCTKLLLDQGADVGKKNYVDCTAYMLCKNPNSKLAQLLHWYSDELLDNTASRQRDNELLFDISHGREFSPISVVNGVDDEEFKMDFKYIVNHCESSTAFVNASVIGMRSCQCVEYCQPLKCRCYGSSQLCYYKDNQRLIDSFNYVEPPVIYECSRLCHCHRTCINRVVQNGTRCRLQVFRTKFKGWGLRAVSAIPKGTFVCQYIGELLTDAEANKRTEDSYVFDLRDGNFCIDAFKYGNVSRFLNHSCEPNVVAVEVFTHHHDERFPNVAFFTCKNVEPKEELCFDYGIRFWAVKSQYFLCACDSELCRFSFNTMTSSLKAFFALPENMQTFTEDPMFLEASSISDEPVASTSSAFSVASTSSAF